MVSHACNAAAASTGPGEARRAIRGHRHARPRLHGCARDWQQGACDGGKAVENWVRLDLLGLMQQLGVVPAP